MSAQKFEKMATPPALPDDSDERGMSPEDLAAIQKDKGGATIDELRGDLDKLNRDLAGLQKKDKEGEGKEGASDQKE